MNLDQSLGARFSAQHVDVLRDHSLDQTPMLKLNQSLMCRVG